MTAKLTPAEITSLCDAGKAAWDSLKPSAPGRAPFTWRGKKYVARHTTFRLLIDTAGGKPVAQRYD